MGLSMNVTYILKGRKNPRKSVSKLLTGTVYNFSLHKICHYFVKQNGNKLKDFPYMAASVFVP